MFRTAVFWLHLACGVIAGLIVLLMSVTGVVLTYERQVQVWEDRTYYTEPQSGQTRLSADELVAASRQLEGFEPTSLAVSSDSSAPAVLRQGRSQTQYLNPYTGDAYQPHADSMSAFFSTVRGWHRWFNINGDGRAAARDITGAANLMFLFLVLSGIYLWLPKIFNRATLAVRVWFNPLVNNSQARDFNWHHVFGFWAAIPLIVIVITATVFNYRWAVNAIYFLAGDELPAASSQEQAEEPPLVAQNRVPLDELLVSATEYSDNWRTLTLAIPDATATSSTVTIDEGDGGQPQKRHALTLDPSSGAVITWAPFNSQTSGFKARRWMRYLHTGEAFGLVGQSIAGLASFAAVLMVWTGLALALRRFLRWRARRKKLAITEAESGSAKPA